MSCSLSTISEASEIVGSQTSWLCTIVDAILFYIGAQFCDPSATTGATYWGEWEEFELQFGNPDTYREMLRVKRTVAGKFAQSNFIDSVAAAAKQLMESSKKQRGDGGASSASADAAAPIVHIAESAAAAAAASAAGQKRKAAEPSPMERLEAAKAVRCGR